MLVPHLELPYPRDKAALIFGVKKDFLPHQRLVMLSCFPGRKAAWGQQGLFLALKLFVMTQCNTYFGALNIPQ